MRRRRIPSRIAALDHVPSAAVDWITRQVCQAALSKEVRKDEDEEEAGEEDEDREGEVS